MHNVQNKVKSLKCINLCQHLTTITLHMTSGKELSCLGELGFYTFPSLICDLFQKHFRLILSSMAES